MESLREAQKRDTRARLYETAIRLFREEGYDVSVDQIVAEAGTAKGTFFNHFPTKDHVLAAYHDEMTGWILSQVESRRFRSCERAVSACLQSCADWAETDRRLGEIVIRHVFSSPILLSADSQNTRRFMDWFARQVERGIASGEIRANVDRETLLSMIAAVLSSTMNAWALGHDIDLRDTLKRRIKFVFDAARA